MEKYGAIIIGAGHAGCEAALSCARLGVKTLIITINANSIAGMSCNPAVGGIAKGQMVREMDAMGAQMGLNTDATGIQFKMLNSSRGAAVWSPRAQCDKEMYSLSMSQTLQRQENLDILQSEVSQIIIKNNKACGVQIATGEKIEARVVIVTTGTFLLGRIYLGKNSFSGGRFNERASLYLSKSLTEDCGLKLSRFKTTTPPRINSNSIDYSKMKEQPGDEKPYPFSHFTEIYQWRSNLNQLPCYLAYTNPETHKIVGESLSLSSIDIGQINSKSPRYCPAIEEKIERYPQKERHQIFVEPEGRFTQETYLNGLFTGLPFEIQEKMIKSIVGLERAKIIRYGYAIEYDYVLPLQIKKTLETKNIENLFLGGQINGTTGYEEAAAQGFMAGVNAARKILGGEPFILGRDEAYIGILIDDITTKGMDEPYRMFTSRAEFRLSIRNDNADLRLIDKGHKLGLISDAVFARFEKYRKIVLDLIEEKDESLEDGNLDGEISPWSLEKARQECEIYNKYKGYAEIEKKMSKKIQNSENRAIPENFDYSLLHSLSAETLQRLSEVRPQTIGQASRIKSVKPSDIAILTVFLEKQRKAKQQIKN